jgi:hypothetical protein
LISGMGVSDNNFGGLQGTSSLEFRPSSFRKGNSIIYGNGNRSFRHRISYTYSTGMMENGWAFTASGSRRYGNQGYIKGTFFDGYSYFLGAEKKINDRHSISIIGFAAPTVQGKTSQATQEAYDLTGSNFYNLNWGYQQGKVRNAVISTNNEPFIQLSHYWKVSEKTTLQASLFGQFSHQGRTSVYYYNAYNNTPNYYKNLPSYLYLRGDSAGGNALTNLIKNYPDTLQYHWDALYQANYNNLSQVTNADGIAGNTVNGKRARYYQYEQVTNQQVYGYNVTAKHDFSSTLHVAGGLNLSESTSENFQVMKDLLGADFYVDVNQFSERTAESFTKSQNNLAITNHIIKVGDKFGYNYDLHIRRSEIFGEFEYKISRLELKASAEFSYNNYWRVGNYQNGVYQDISLGKSDPLAFLNKGFKTGIVYKISGRHFLTLNGMLASRPPLPRNVYISPGIRNTTQNIVTNEQVLGGDANYIIRYPKFKLRATAYYMQVNNQMLVKNFFHEELNSLVNYAMSGINTLYTGTEFGADVKVYRGLSANAVYSKADFIYTSHPTVTVTTNNMDSILVKDRVLYLTNYKIGGNPQTVASFGLRYAGVQNYSLGASFNYYTDIYLEPNPDRRSVEALAKYVSSDPQWNTILAQQKFSGGYIVNANAGKSIRYKKLILDNQKLVTGGFEQMRFDPDQPSRFPPKLAYHYGRTYNAQISFRF